MTTTGESLGTSSAPKVPPKQDYPGHAAGDRLLLGLLIVLIVGVPTIFLPTTFTTFDVPQLTLLWVLAVAVVLVGLHRIVVSGVVEFGPPALTVASVCFLVALVLTSVLSDQPWVAFTGLTVRGAGAISYGLCLGLLYAAFWLSRHSSVKPLVLAFVGAHGLVVLYALLQAHDLDPFVWPPGILYVGPVFSTLGNPNFSSGYVALTLPLLTWLAFGSRLPVVVRVAAGAGIGASCVALAYLHSFQGHATALAAIPVLGHWAWLRVPPERLVAVVLVVPSAAVIVGVPLVFDSPGSGLLFGLMASVGASASLGAWWDRRSSGFTETGTRTNDSAARTASRLGQRKWIPLMFALAVAAGGIVAVGGRVFNQFESGLEQRFAFWRTSLSIFSSNPIVGTGLETYPAHFTAHRPLSHAVQYERVLSDSPHSVPLGLLSGGGLLLAITYWALMAVILRSGVRAVRRAVGAGRLLYGAVLAAWCAYHVQSSVSMDVPGLIYTQWLLGGMLLAGGAVEGSPRRVLPWAPGRPRSPSSRLRNPGWSAAGVAFLLVVALAFLLQPLTAPLRADLAAYRAQEALDRADYQDAGDELLTAIDLQPRNYRYAEGMALVYGESGLYDLAYGERVRSARLQPGNPYLALISARFALAIGHLDEAKYWFERALTVEPNGTEVLTSVAAFYAGQGDFDRSAELLGIFESLRTGDWEVWRTARGIYEILGDEVAIERARPCALLNQEGCWVHQ